MDAPAERENDEVIEDLSVEGETVTGGAVIKVKPTSPGRRLVGTDDGSAD